MKSRFQLIATVLAARPAAALALFLIWGLFFAAGLSYYVLTTSGLKLFRFDAVQAATFMTSLSITVFLILSWRLLNINQILWQSILTAFNALKKRPPNEPELEKLRSHYTQIAFKGGYFSRLIQLFRQTPEPTAMLVAMMVFLTLTLSICFELLSDLPKHSFWGSTNNGIPWLWAIFASFYLIYNDYWMINSLVKRAINTSDINPEDYEQILKQFKQELTAMELRCFELKYEENNRTKNLAQALNIGLNTVKTHINNMNRKWEALAQTRGINVDLKTFIRLKP